MFNPTLTNILAGFSKTIDRLDTLIARNSTRLGNNRDRADKIRIENDSITSENIRAKAVVERLRELIVD